MKPRAFSFLAIPAGGRIYAVPVKLSDNYPSETVFGPLPPEVAEQWEVRWVLAPFLLRKADGMRPEVVVEEKL